MKVQMDGLALKMDILKQILIYFSGLHANFNIYLYLQFCEFIYNCI